MLISVQWATSSMSTSFSGCLPHCVVLLILLWLFSFWQIKYDDDDDDDRWCFTEVEGSVITARGPSRAWPSIASRLGGMHPSGTAIDRQYRWLIGWLADWFIDWLIDWLTEEQHRPARDRRSFIRPLSLGSATMFTNLSKAVMARVKFRGPQWRDR